MSAIQKILVENNHIIIVDAYLPTLDIDTEEVAANLTRPYDRAEAESEIESRIRTAFPDLNPSLTIDELSPVFRAEFGGWA